MSSDRKGWVYVLSNPSIPGQLKIGYTDTAVEVRMERLYSTELPTPFKKEYEALVLNARDVERHTHSLLSQYRTNRDREFFQCELIQAVKAVREAVSLLSTEILHEETFFEEEKEKKSKPSFFKDSSFREKIEKDVREGVLYIKGLGIPYTGKIFEVCEGKKFAEEVYANGEKQGQWTRWNDNGEIRIQENFKDGKRDGDYINSRATGDWQYKKKGYYEDDKFTGTEYSRYANSHGYEKNYKNGMEHGLSRSWDHLGNLSSECNYKEDEWHGLCIEYYYGGQKMCEGIYKDGELVDGTEKYYSIDEDALYEDTSFVEKLETDIREGVLYIKGSDMPFTGKLFSLGKLGLKGREHNYRDGKKDGRQIIYFDCGEKIHFDDNFKDGKENGLRICYHENGRILWQKNYHNGKENGLQFWWVNPDQKNPVIFKYVDGKEIEGYKYDGEEDIPYNP